MLEEIGTMENIPKFIEDVKNKKKLMFGFGHRVYKNYDPRAPLCKKLAEEVFKVVGREPLIDIAMELERIARMKNTSLITSFILMWIFTQALSTKYGIPYRLFPCAFHNSSNRWLAFTLERISR